LNEVSVSLLKPHPQNAEFFPEKLPEHLWNELVADIKENGVINPLIVTPDYTVIAGHLRLEAAKEAGLTHVPVVIRDINPESDEAISMLIKDNLLRRHLNDVQVARLIRKLKEEYGVKHGGDRRSKEALESNGQNVRLKIAEMMGLNERHVRRLDKINNLIPDFKSLLETGKWSATTVASIIGSLPSEEQRKLFASLGESGICGLSVREAQELKKELDSLRKESERSCSQRYGLLGVRHWGVYYLCSGDVEKLHLINERKKKMAIGNFDSLTWTLDEAESALQEDPDEMWESKYKELKESLLREILERIQKIS
jgi:ParB family chromosome partitioning protein